MKQQPNTFFIEAWNFKMWGPHYVSLMGPFPLEYQKQILDELEKNLPKEAKFVSYVSSEA